MPTNGTTPTNAITPLRDVPLHTSVAKVDDWQLVGSQPYRVSFGVSRTFTDHELQISSSPNRGNVWRNAEISGRNRRTLKTLFLHAHYPIQRCIDDLAGG